MKKIFLAALATTISIATFAQGPGHQRTNIPYHPRVNEVNGRIDNQERRIAEERREGDLTRAQAWHDRRNLTAINHEKREMRSMDNGHLTRADQRSLNQQLNHNSRRIGY